MPRSRPVRSHEFESDDASPAPATFSDGLPLPRLFVFDLDYTLWPLWVDTHVSGALRADPSSAPGIAAVDRIGTACRFYADVGSVLGQIKERGCGLAAASRTSAPEIARSMLTLLHAGGGEAGRGSRGPAIRLFDALEIYPGSKLKHFRRLRERMGVPFEEMLFFDDERRNREVESLGVTMLLVEDGVSRKEIDRGVRLWRERNGRGGGDAEKGEGKE